LIVFRITLQRYAGSLYASGYPNCWNSKGIRMIYASGSRALATLENIVHRSGEGLNGMFTIMEIKIAESLDIFEIKSKQLPAGWTSRKNRSITQFIGDEWIRHNSSVVLLVPSVIIPGENNVLLNPAHPDFKKVKIIRSEQFAFDPRISKN